MEAESLSAGSPEAESREDMERGIGCAAETGFAAAGDGVIFVDGAAFGNGIFAEVSVFEGCVIFEDDAIFEGGGLRLAGSIVMNNLAGN